MDSSVAHIHPVWDDVPADPNVEECLEAALAIPGATAVALMDYSSGYCLGAGGAGVDAGSIAEGYVEVVRAELRTMRSLALRDNLEDILVTRGRQYHLIRILTSEPGLFLLLVLDRGSCNLPLTRHRIGQIDRELVV